MSGRIASRARQWIWAQPGRARVAALMAVVSLAGAGAYVNLGPDDGSSGRVRHDRGVLTTGTASGERGATPGTDDGSEAPPGSSDVGSSDGGPNGAGSAATGGALPGTATPGAPTGGTSTPAGGGQTSTTSGPGDEGAAPAGGKATTTTTTTRPAGAGAATSPPPAAEGPGWRLLPKAPIGGRMGHSTVWTGREMVVWGGTGDPGADPLTDGAAYDPAARAWRKIPGAPLSPRFDAESFWTGSEMVIFGGTSVDGDILADGAVWNAASNAWRPMAASPLGARDGAVVAWAGDRLVIWGGAALIASDDPDSGGEYEMRNDGSAYLPATDGWVPVAAAPIPPRSGADSVWTGTHLVVSGGSREGEDDDRNDGAALDPATGAWSAIAARPAPGACGGEVPCGGFWTGAMAVFPSAGLAYHPAGDRWSAVAPYPAGGGFVAGETTVWTGQRLLVWGTPSETSGDDVVNDEAAADENSGDREAAPVAWTYDPGNNSWQQFPSGPLSGRKYHTAVWTGQDMLVWGGMAEDSGLADGAAFRP